MKIYIFHDNSKSNLKIYLFSIMIITIVLTISFMGYKSEGTEIFSYTSLFISTIIFCVLFETWMTFRIVNSILINNDRIEIITQKLQEQILLENIVEIKYFSMQTTGDTYVWIEKKKGVKKSKLNFFRITFSPGESDGKNKLADLITELNKNVLVKEILTFHFKKKEHQ